MSTLTGPNTYPSSSSEQFLAYNNTTVETSTTSPQMSPISNPDFSPYSAIEQYEETSSAYAEEGLSRYPPQVAYSLFHYYYHFLVSLTLFKFSDYSDYSHVSFQNDSHSNSLELVHSYRRIPIIADDLDYMNSPSSSSQKKKITGQLTATRQQLTAKFECIAW
ncbi:hypothetical protein Clacol_002863 [Clathrus columnatus]|uniref:Uncharacterized protein n=1 Tax=Clathrus columnatus TaxID=1419009 RepID=A0AAV5A5Y7_9AGAM|nr:hypothetical protein Clacol_002863 [Clathrus columnatus]